MVVVIILEAIPELLLFSFSFGQKRTNFSMHWALSILSDFSFRFRLDVRPIDKYLNTTQRHIELLLSSVCVSIAISTHRFAGYLAPTSTSPTAFVL